MRRVYFKSDALALFVLAVFPLIAYAEPLLEHRLLGPGDGVALHLPLRVEAFRAYRDLSLPFFNPREFLGTPLLAAYRGGVLYPLTPLLSPFDEFSAFQSLILISIALAGVLTYLYLKRLGAGALGAFVGALSFAYGPYLLGHFEDTATLVASPMLPLVLLAAESHMNRASSSRLLGLAVSIALLILAGSPEALRAGGALLFGRLLLGHTVSPSARTPSRAASVLAIALGFALAAPQWMPTLHLLPSVGRQVTGLAAESATDGLSGLSGLILKTVTHTPAASLAIASLPLLFERLPVRVLLLSVLASLALQIGRGPLLAPGALPLVLEFALASLAGLALDEQWKERTTRRGRRLRAYFLVASLASVGVLSIAAATLGGLPDRLAAAVGVYAIALITYFALADAPGEVAAGAFLLPLAVSFALQPTSREIFKDAPTRGQLVGGTPTRRAVDAALKDLGPAPRVLTLVQSFPTELALDLGFAGFGALTPRIQANGYDPMAPFGVRRTLGEMGARGTLTEKSVMPNIDVLRTWAIDAVQVQTRDLVSSEGVSLNVSLEPGSRRSFATPFLRVKAVLLRVEGERSASVNVFTRVNGTREILLASLPAQQDVLRIPVPPYRTDAMIIETPATSRALMLRHLAIETVDGAVLSVSPFSSYLSDPGFQEIALTPQIKAFRILRTRSLVEARSGAASHGPTPGGRLEIESPDGGSADIALVPLPGWSANVPLHEQSGHLSVELNAGISTLRYTPPFFLAATFLALIGLLISFTLLFRPTIAARLLKSGRDEGK